LVTLRFGPAIASHRYPREASASSIVTSRQTEAVQCLGSLLIPDISVPLLVHQWNVTKKPLPWTTGLLLLPSPI
jgi:hypothetical protein